LNEYEMTISVRKLIEKQRTTVEQEFLKVLLPDHTNLAVFPVAETRDPFCDPVRATFDTCGPKLVKWALDGGSVEEAQESLMSIIRIKSLQSPIPSETIAFLPALKGILRNMILTKIKEHDREELLALVESRIDRLLLIALDCYVQCYDKINQIRISEARAERDRLLKLVRVMGTEGKG
jgi:hypothetical protein